MPWAAYGSLFWLTVNAGLLVVAVRRISDEQFGAERRASVRFDVHGRGELDGQPVLLIDASLTGMQVALPFSAEVVPAAGSTSRLRMTVGQTEVELEVVVRSAREQQVASWMSTWVLGLEFTLGQVEARATLALGLFGTEGELTRAGLPVPVPVPLPVLEPLPDVARLVPAQPPAPALVPVTPPSPARGTSRADATSLADASMAAALHLDPAELPGRRTLADDLADRVTACLLRELAPTATAPVHDAPSGEGEPREPLEAT